MVTEGLVESSGGSEVRESEPCMKSIRDRTMSFILNDIEKSQLVLGKSTLVKVF